MNVRTTRRDFLGKTVTTTALLGLGDFSFLSELPIVTAEEAQLPPKLVRLHPDIEPLVRMLEEISRDRLLEEFAQRIRAGLTYREVLAALLLAGVRNVQPRPVGFKFHAVLVVNSAHLASLASPDTDRWLPIFWALDYFKDSQARNQREGNWRLGAVDESAVPSSEKAKQAFIDAMNNWDEAAADASVAGLARSVQPREIFEIFCRFGARDFREIGHKAIYVANSWRTLQHIGWQHAEPVLRSLAYALLDHEGENPARADALPDRPWKRNLELAQKLRPDWRSGKGDISATIEMLETLRQGSDADACGKVVEILNQGIAPQAIWDALFDGACELLMREPGIVSLHAVTSTNALHFAFQTSSNDETRRLLLLQNAAFLTLFRGSPKTSKQAVRIEQLEPLTLNSSGSEAIAEIFRTLGGDRLHAARKVLSYLKENPQPKEFIDAARRLVFLKGQNAHDYKFSSAVFEDYEHLSPGWREHYLAASMFNLYGSSAKDNELVARTRAALKA